MFKLRFHIFVLQLQIIELQFEKILIHIDFGWHMMIIQIEKMFLYLKYWRHRTELQQLFSQYTWWLKK